MGVSIVYESTSDHTTDIVQREWCWPGEARSSGWGYCTGSPRGSHQADQRAAHHGGTLQEVDVLWLHEEMNKNCILK